MKYWVMGRMVLGFVLGFQAAMAYAECPRLDQGETAEDCPWADVVRALDSIATRDGSLKSAAIDAKLREMLPQFSSLISHEAMATQSILPLWGRSLNFDEGARATIVRDEIIDYLLGRFGVAPREDRIVHAGVEHTYGYMLTNLQTPFGYKRARWVRDDLEAGFGLKRGTLSPSGKAGGFLSNVTAFAGSIAFADHPAALAEIQELQMISGQIREFPYGSLQVSRLEETILADDGRTVVLRTDFVPFTGKTGANAEALIYSIFDSAVGHPQLITVFPVAADFAAKALDSKSLGENQPIITRYNAYVPGITGSKKKFTGKRCVTSADPRRNPSVEKRCH